MTDASNAEESRTVETEVETTEIVPTIEAGSEANALAQAIQETADLNYLMKHAEFEHLQRVAKMFANSTIVPQRFQDNQADCAIVLAMAWRHRADPMMFFNGVYVVKGRPGMEAKLAIALVNSQKVFTGPIQYKFDGEGLDRKCTAFATHRQSGQVCEAECSIKMAKDEGWLGQNPKWTSMPDVMLRYRSAIFLIRFYCPEAMFGMSTSDELHEISAQSVDVEVLGKQRAAIAEKVSAATGRLALPPAKEETPIAEVIANAPKVEEEREEDPPAEAPPEPSPDERRAERQELHAKYVELCETLQVDPSPITKLSTPKLRSEVERLSAKLKQ